MPPDDFRDLLIEVVDHHRQMVSDEAVPATNHEIAGFGFQALALLALQRIDEFDRCVIRQDTNRKSIATAAVPTGARINRA